MYGCSPITGIVFLGGVDVKCRCTGVACKGVGGLDDYPVCYAFRVDPKSEIMLDGKLFLHWLV